MRRKCVEQGHKWRAWSPGDHDAWCGRWFCRAKRRTQMGAFIDSIAGGLLSERVPGEAPDIRLTKGGL